MSTMGRTCVPITTMLLGLLLVQVLATSSELNEDKYEPMVAFLCNKPAMHRTPIGWERDEKHGCLDSSVEILNYCKSLYPNHDITNIVEANYMVTIEDWCGIGHKHCHSHGTHTVRPFRCLVGAFQSTALLVPEHCLFDHYHDTKICETYETWNATSLQKCTEKGLVKQSFDILLPCGIDRFSGCEYVCCPQPQATPVTLEIEELDEEDDDDDIDEDDEDYDSEEDDDEDNEDYIDDDDEDEDDEDDEDDDEDEDEYDNMSQDVSQSSESDNVEDLQIPDNGAYMKYLKNEDMEQVVTEHDRFTQARADWQTVHHEKITKMMKQWSEARQRVMDMKKTDPKTADKLDQEITERFQRMYHALEKEGIAEKQQLNTLHQQHVQKVLNEKKRIAMQMYMEELQKDEPQTSRVLKTIERYIRVEEKDRQHCVNHFEHVRDTDPEEAQRIRGQTIDHLNWIDKRINQSIKMLARLPEIEKKVKPEVEKYLANYKTIDATVDVILTPVTLDEQQELVEQYKESMVAEADKQDEKPESDSSSSSSSSSSSEEETFTDEKQDIAHIQVDIDEDDDEVVEDEHKYFDVQEQQPQFAAHAQNSEMHVDAGNGAQIQHILPSTTTYGATFGIAMGSIAVFVIIVVAVVMLRKRSTRQRVTHGLVEIDPAASPEERHVANMQMNGYENPTYRYFEKKPLI